MKLSALIYRGQLVEITQVEDGFQFGEHGNHYHIPVKAVKAHLCMINPTLREDTDVSSDSSIHLRN